ncbi:hypothetical protein GGR56DRAFT_446973 [Xylariaceae sp. FL0804]|nr:hypothetical protein GGR56DRAFT_446973 [Xylariaceae sp. FL0804]
MNVRRSPKTSAALGWRRRRRVFVLLVREWLPRRSSGSISWRISWLFLRRATRPCYASRVTTRHGVNRGRGSRPIVAASEPEMEMPTALATAASFLLFASRFLQVLACTSARCAVHRVTPGRQTYRAGATSLPPDRPATIGPASGPVPGDKGHDLGP